MLARESSATVGLRPHIRVPRSGRSTVSRTLVRVTDDRRTAEEDQDVLGFDAHADRYQGIRNERPIPPSERQVIAKPAIDVTAWIVWERDGLELIDSRAEAWAGRDVLVAMRDKRWRLLGVWLAAQDVRRR